MAQPIILICDSRGKGLFNTLQSFPGKDIRVLTYSGAKLYRSVKLAEYTVRKYQPEQVYVLSGVNNLTHMDKTTRKILVLSHDKDKIVQQIRDEMNFAYKKLQKITTMKTKVMFAPLTGICIGKFNDVDLSSVISEQEILNQAVLETNEIIIDFNEQNGVRTP